MILTMTFKVEHHTFNYVAHRIAVKPDDRYEEWQVGQNDEHPYYATGQAILKAGVSGIVTGHATPLEL